VACRPAVSSPRAHATSGLATRHEDLGCAAGGLVVIEVRRDWAPNGVDRFFNLVSNGFYDDVRIPADQMLVLPRRKPGETGGGAIGNPNAGLGMMFVGVARAAFEETLEYCKQRVQGGKPLVEHQLTQRKLFDMLTKVETARAYARSVMLYNNTNPLGMGWYSNASKVYATQMAYEIADEGVQLHGGMGLSKGTLIEKLFRDTRAGLIEDGANDTLALTAAPTMIKGYEY